MTSSPFTVSRCNPFSLARVLPQPPSHVTLVARLTPMEATSQFKTYCTNRLSKSSRPTEIGSVAPWSSLAAPGPIGALPTGKTPASDDPSGVFCHQGERTEANSPKCSDFTSCARTTSDMTEVAARASADCRLVDWAIAAYRLFSAASGLGLSSFLSWCTSRLDVRARREYKR